MQIIIPMSGFGERFRKAGYKLPKPLIEIDKKPIIAHVIDMFPNEKDFIFICNQEHLDNPDYKMQETIKSYCQSGRIVGIPPHKLGPIHAVRQVEHLIDSNRPVIVNYCDFTCYWNWQNFKEFVAKTNCSGAIPAYKGFHPHTLGSTNYAYMQESKGWVKDIQEKQPYTDNRMQEFASSGTYYFASGKIMHEAFNTVVKNNVNVGGEYYVSLAYKPLLEAEEKIAVYPLQHFMQWGTPEDVAEYNCWSHTFSRLIKKEPISEPQGTVIVPMAGLGQRFANEGYKITKPLISVSGKPMVVQATDDLPAANNHVFVLRKDMQGHYEISDTLGKTYPGAIIETIDKVTEGQACTALIGLDALEKNLKAHAQPLTFGACDNGVLYDAEKLAALTADPEIDVIVWGVRGHSNAVRRPQMFGWIDAEENANIKNISVKTPLKNPATDPIVIGTFTFRKGDDFRRVVERLIARDGRINGEFYIDSCINDAIELGLNCRFFEVDSFISWGTPNDLKTFEYWQSCFHKWQSHPYSLELDQHIEKETLSQLKNKYAEMHIELPGLSL
ncbi:MAG: sugar phosphate nucleotidyltransferase [Pseudomonadota bacterium]